MTATFHVGDAIEVMSKLPENSVDLVLTSPPFLALRSYLPADHPDKSLEGGSQATPGEYIDWLIDVVEACDRVLAPHGSMAIELGDTYAGSGGGGGDYLPGGLREGQAQFAGSAASMRESNAAHWRQKNRKQPPNTAMRLNDDGSVKTDAATRASESKNREQITPLAAGPGWPLAKSLSLIPELFRLTLVYGTNPLTGRQTERWRLRNVVRWVRPNPPVGALGDKFRPATSELMVFCKSAKRYFDLDAVRTPHQSDPTKFTGNGYEKGRPEGLGVGTISEPGNPAGAPPLDWWNIPLLEGEEETRYGPKDAGPDRRPRNTNGPKSKEADRSTQSKWETRTSNPAGTPPLDWWNIPPGGYEGAHYAVFPPELCIKPIKAMCPEKVCRVCGEPSRRIVKPTRDYSEAMAAAAPGRAALRHDNDGGNNYRQNRPEMADYQTTGFSDCGHNDWRPGLVLDPFVGSGTTLLVATGHGRDAIGIDLDERNFELALQRVGPFILERAL